MSLDLDLQQTPASNPKAMLKVFSQLPRATTPETHVFTFTSATSARTEADTIKDALSVAIQAIKGRSDLGLAVAGAATGGASQALATANAVSSSSVAGAAAGGGAGGRDHQNAGSGWYDDVRLKADVELQQSLLKADPSLQKTFMESLRTKPDSISNAQFTSQFWSTRIPLLRAHAIEKNQSRGGYNVLSTIKSKTEDNVTRLSISKEQIQLIFNQHALVKRVYDENVPNKLNESAFWSKFFQSRLFKKLKGEKIVDSDPLDPTIDQYLREDDRERQKERRLESNVHIPHIIDLEGNEENHSQRKGNQPDLTMRPSSLNKAPIIRTLNTLSERIMAEVAPVDAYPSQSSNNADEETFRELALHDLEGDAEEHRIILSVKDQQRFFAEGGDDADQVQDGLSSLILDPAEVLHVMKQDLKTASNGPDGMNLQDAIGVHDESDSDDDDDDDDDALGDDAGMGGGNGAKRAHVGSKTSIAKATTQILQAIAQRKAQTDDVSSRPQPSSSSSTSTTASPSVPCPPGLSAALFDRVTLTHATTTEFLHHFWSVFLSGDASRAEEVSALVESLDRAMTRIDAVATDAGEEREAEMQRRRQEVRDVYHATGKKVRFKPDTVPGGRAAVQEMLAPTVRAVELARGKYKRALAEGESC